MPRETKAQREAREAKEKLEAASAEATEAPAGVEEPPQPDQPEPPQQNVVHVLVNYDEDGNISIADVVATGQIRPTEISDLLTMGLQFWRKKAGLIS